MSKSSSDYEIGDLIRHPNKPDWGVGQIKENKITGRVTVFFERAGYKIISLEHIALIKASDLEYESDTLDDFHYTSCYCENDEYKILSDIENESIPRNALANDCCWREICRVRGRHYRSVRDETWVSICRDRAYLKYAGG